MSRPILKAPYLFCFLLLFPPNILHAQTNHYDFESSIAPWQQHGNCRIKRVDGGYDSPRACEISRRRKYYDGITLPIKDLVAEGEDYFFEAYVKTGSVDSGRLRFEIIQVDSSGTRYLTRGETEANSSTWTAMRAGFKLTPGQQLGELSLVINGHFEDQRSFNFLVDEITVAKNDWKTAANQRIEQHRKRNVNVVLKRRSGRTVRGYQVEVQQIEHGFPFGSALNDAHINNKQYADFFRQHFDHGTIEWFSQWPAVEQTRGIEDYARADAAVEFAHQNGIRLRGHALAWGVEHGRPTWLGSLGSEEIRLELDERISNVVSRYQDDLTGWDVENEILADNFFGEYLGSTNHAEMFQQAKSIAPDLEYSTNEYDLILSPYRTEQYIDLLQQLESDGADVDSIGVQGHVIEYFSPKALEICLDRLSTQGKPIRISEFDFEHPDPNVRATVLEDFYRYAFSRPEVNGITMWGFWAGSHWRGEDASLIESDWTINAAGQKYLDLMKEWTTELDGISDVNGDFEFCGFHGTYLIRTTNPDTGRTNLHLVDVSPGNGDLTVELEIKDGADESLTVYTTDGDDVLNYDLSRPNQFELNSRKIFIDPEIEFSSIWFSGGDGEDRIQFISKPVPSHLHLTSNSVYTYQSDQHFFFDGFENATCIAIDPKSTLTLADTPAADMLVSYPNSTSLQTPDILIRGTDFRTVYARSTMGDDIAAMYGTESTDYVSCDFSKVTYRNGSSRRHAIGFPTNIAVGDPVRDILHLHMDESVKNTTCEPDRVLISNERFSLQAEDFRRTTFFKPHPGRETVQLVGDSNDERIVGFPDIKVWQSISTFAIFHNNNWEFRYPADSGGSDELIVYDSPSDDRVDINQHQILVDSVDTYRIDYFDRIRAYSREGGADRATVNSATMRYDLYGNWNK